MTALKPARRLTLCVFAIALAGTASTSPILADHPHSARKRDQAPKHPAADAARPHSKSYRLQSGGSDIRSATSPQKSGIGVFLSALAALLASFMIMLPRRGGPNLGHIRVARLQRFASGFTASAASLMAATGAGIALAGAGSPDFDRGALVINIHLASTLLLVLGLVLMLASRSWLKSLKPAHDAPAQHALAFWPAVAATAAVSVSGFILATPLVFTGPQGHQAAATLHIFAGTALAVIMAPRDLRHFGRRLAGGWRSMPKSQRLVPRRAS